MSKKLHSKLLAVILSIAICCATLCGSIFAAHAAAAYYNGTYSFEGGVAPYGAKQATVDVTFSLQAGFVAGEFALDNTAGNFAGIASAEITKGTRADSSAFDASVIDVSIAKSADADGQLPKVIFYGKSDDSFDVAYSSLTFKLTINMTSSVAASSQYSVALADYTFTELGGTDLGIEFTGNAGSIHTHSGSLNMNNLTSESNKNFNSVYHQVDTTAKCTYCGNAAESYIQLYPDYNTDSSAVAAGTQPDGNIGISGITVVHNDNGNLSVNIHGCAADGYSDSYIVITDTKGKVMATLNESTVSPYADVILDSNAQMWSFEKLSARDINTELVITMLSHTTVSNKNTLAYSRSFEFSLADYCTKVVDENAMWPVGTSGEQKLADKNVAAGLYYYGASIEENIFDKNSSTEEFKYIDKKVDTWNGTTTEPTTLDEDGTTYLITTAEELAWIALYGHNDTAGKSYKVADDIGAFYLTPNGAESYDNSSIDRLKETLSAENDLKGSKLNKWADKRYVQNSDTDKGWAAFQGTFDGNGVTIYGLPSVSTSANAGLFPVIKGDVTIKNVKVTDSYISGYRNAGAIVGSTFNNTNVVNSISFEKCVVVNNYIAQTQANTTAGWSNIGGLAGNVGTVSTSVKVASCVVLDNDMSNASIANFKTRAFFGHWATAQGTPSTFINSFTDLNVYTSSYWALVEAGYSNVYTTCTDEPEYTPNNANEVHILESTDEMKGNNALTNMNLSRNVWFDTADYPQLRVFHDMKIKSISETQHQLVCAHKIGNTPCDVVGLTENHTLVENAEGTQKTCSVCGYSQEIVSNLETVNANYAVWTGDKTVPTKQDTEGNWIIESPEELAWVALVGKDDTHDSLDKTYKIADNSVFNMNGYTNVNINSTAAEVKAATATDAKYNWNGSSSNFRGNFNGNGAIIYNVRGDRYYGDNVEIEFGGLFPKFNYGRGINNSSKSAKFENITVKASYFSGVNYAGGIVGMCYGSTSNTLTIENCSVENCYLYSRGYTSNLNGSGAAATLVAMSEHWTTTINNCSTINNTVDALHNDGGFIASSSAYNSSITIGNSISIGTLPYPVATEDALETDLAGRRIFTQAVYANVYTDQTSSKAGVTTLTTAQLQGSNAVTTMGLDSNWLATNSYPQLAVFHELTDVYVDENNHRKECVLIINGERCETCGVNTAHTLTPNDEGTANECICGYSEEIIGNTVVPQYKSIVTWDGQTKTALTDADKDENGTYIITTAAQLAWLALGGNGASTDGNTYKIHDDIKEIYINSGTRDLTLSQVENKLDGNNANDWGFNTWQNKDNYGFSGTFDGNGVTIYGLYHAFADDQAAGAYNGGLFPYANGDVTIKNVTIKNSYVEGWYVSGAIIGDWTAAGGTATFDKCVVTNCYVGTRSTGHGWAANSGSGLCGGGDGSPTKYTINECIVYGNTLVSSENETCSAFVSVFNLADATSYSVTNSIAVDYTPFPASSATGYIATKPDNIPTMYNNVYTTLNMSGKGWQGADFPEGYIFTKTYDEMQGVGAVAAMNLGNNWFDTVDGYPELHVFHDMITATLDENNHQYVCQHFIDNVQCTVCGPVEAHTEGSCVCGYKATADDDSSINYNNITPQVWQGEIAPGFSDTTHQGTSEADAIIISTPAELAYLITISQDTSITNPTVGKYYKAADNLVFNMNGLEGINLNSSLDDVSSATPTTNNWGTKTFINTGTAYGFGGTFDGNGLIIYNLYSSAEAAGLFTVYRGGATVKNLTVKNSKLVGTNPAGGILGWHSHGETGTKATVDGCVVENCDISSTSTNASWGVGSIMASTRYAQHTINNCLVVNNKITSTGSISTGIVGHVQGEYYKPAVTNCLIINSDTSRIASAITPNYTNCYTTQASPDSGLTVKTDAEMKGENTLTAMGLDESWIATNSYPQLAVFHDIVTVILDGLKHQSICRISIGGTPCSVCTDAVAHNFEENDEHTEINCDVCGYGYAIKGINSLNLPESVKAQLTANATYVSNFETNAKFINVYGADQPGEDEIGNEFAIYATTLNLTVNPHYVFQFAFHGDYKTNRSNIYATFTVGDDVYSTEKVETDGKLGANWANSKSAGRYHTYRFRQLPISKLCKPIVVKVYYNNNEYDFGSYSAAGFAINAIGLGADYVNHANAAKALVYYSEMLAAREAINAQ